MFIVFSPHTVVVVDPALKSFFSHNLHQTLTHNPYIKFHKNAGKQLNIITIKFDTELNSIKNIVVNHNLQNS